jgi:hypothetical protein
MYSSCFREYTRRPPGPAQNSQDTVPNAVPVEAQSRNRLKQALKIARKTQLQGDSLTR